MTVAAPLSAQVIESKHRLAPLLGAHSVAVVGASPREGSFGMRLAQSVFSAGYQGETFFVNPRYQSILGRSCFGDFADLPCAPDLAILGVGALNLENALIAAINSGAKSAVIFDACHGETPSGAPLLPRLRDIAREASLPICGGSGMGLINVETGCVASFYRASHLKPGGISLIAHSGSVFTTLAMNDARFRFNLLVSPGQEIGATVDEYIDYATTIRTTNVIAVFMETARNPVGFVASLKKARRAGIPVVVCKVGRTEESARMARSHTGALAGSKDAYNAVLEECGAISVDTIDQLMNVALLCSTGRMPGSGGVGLVTDSGGLRELTMDLAAERTATLARFSDQTIKLLREVLPAKLEPSNPLDCAADLTDDYAKVFEDGVDILAKAGEVSMIGLEADLRDDYVYESRLEALALDLAKRTEKPCFFYSSFGRANTQKLAERLIDQGVPCVNGIGEALTAVALLQSWSDLGAVSGEDAAACHPPSQTTLAWRGRLSGVKRFDEHLALEMLSAFNVPAVSSEVCANWPEVVQAAARFGYPLVLKTAEAGIDHKSDQGGVFLNLANEIELNAAYQKVSSILGPRVILQRMAQKGIELAFGCVRDPEFGPIVMVSAGGILVEYFSDRQFARAPISDDHGLKMIERLTIGRLLNGVRGAAPADKHAAARALSAFSHMCASLGDAISEIDLNPIIVSAGGAIVVDALIIPAKSEV